MTLVEWVMAIGVGALMRAEAARKSAKASKQYEPKSSIPIVLLMAIVGFWFMYYWEQFNLSVSLAIPGSFLGVEVLLVAGSLQN